MRRALRGSGDGEGTAAHRRPDRPRARLTAAVTLLLLVAGVFLAAPRISSAVAEAIGVRSILAEECVRHDARPPAGDPDGSSCHFGGFCCAASCDGSTPADAASARLLGPRPRPSSLARACDAREDFLALAGWASAWSSRAPPRPL